MNVKDKNIEDIEFFDGETIDNKYFQLGNSKDYVININGLSLKECLDFLFNNAPQKANSYFFRIDYDLNMFFNNENFEEMETDIVEFFEGEEKNFYGYDIQYFRHKMLFMRKGRMKKTFYDVSNFLHTSFIKTLELFEVFIKSDDEKFLKEYKLKRSDFNSDDIKNIIEYNKLECELGIRLCKKIFQILPNDLKTTRLYGSSALSHKFLKDREIEKLNWFFEDRLNSKPFESAYFGGRMETFKLGKFGKCYKYDINSAYPNVIKDLRVIEGVEINHNFDIFENDIIETNLYYCEMEIFDFKLIGLLPFRLKSGYLIFPNKVKGYYYGCEIIQALEHNFSIKLEVIQEIQISLGKKIFEKDNGINEIQDLYDKRLKLKKKKDLRNMVYKILLNSIYGKFAQQSGKHQFLNFYYAGYITSKTRSVLLDAVKENIEDIIFFATDGILTKKKLNKLVIGEKLGQWDFEEYKSAYVVQSGVYELTTYDNKKTYAERGFRANFEELLKSIKKNGIYEMESNVFIGNKYFSKNYKAYAGNRCKFVKVKRVISIYNQFKRVYDEINLTRSNDSVLLSLDQVNYINSLLPVQNFDFEDFEMYNLNEVINN